MWKDLTILHASFRDFLVDEARAGLHHIDSDEWHHTQFCVCLSLGINSPRLLSGLAFPISSPRLPLKEIGTWMCAELQDCFSYSSRQDQLAAFAQESLEESAWYSHFEDPDWSPDEDMLGLVDLFIGITKILSPEDKVCLPFIFSCHNSAQLLLTQRDAVFTPATQLRVEDFVIRLRKLCDSALLNYISKLADTPVKRNHLHIVYTAVDETKFRGYGFDNNAVKDVASFLDLDAMGGPPQIRHYQTRMVSAGIPRDVAFGSRTERHVSLSSKSVVAFVSARYLRYLKTR